VEVRVGWFVYLFVDECDFVENVGFLYFESEVIVFVCVFVYVVEDGDVVVFLGDVVD